MSGCVTEVQMIMNLTRIYFVKPSCEQWEGCKNREVYPTISTVSETSLMHMHSISKRIDAI